MRPDKRLLPITNIEGNISTDILRTVIEAVMLMQPVTDDKNLECFHDKFKIYDGKIKKKTYKCLLLSYVKSQPYTIKFSANVCKMLSCFIK